MSRMQNRNPSLPMEDAAEAVEREGGFVHLIYLSDATNGIIRYSRTAGGPVLSQGFHRTWFQAVMGRRPRVRQGRTTGRG